MERAEQMLVLVLSWQHMTNKIQKLSTTLLLIFASSYAVAEIKADQVIGIGKVLNQFDQTSRRNGELILIHKIYVDYQNQRYECIINKTYGTIKCVKND